MAVHYSKMLTAFIESPYMSSQKHNLSKVADTKNKLVNLQTKKVFYLSSAGAYKLAAKSSQWNIRCDALDNVDYIALIKEPTMQLWVVPKGEFLKLSKLVETKTKGAKPYYSILINTGVKLPGDSRKRVEHSYTQEEMEKFSKTFITAAERRLLESKGKVVPVALPKDIQKTSEEIKEVLKQSPNLAERVQERVNNSHALIRKDSLMTQKKALEEAYILIGVTLNTLFNGGFTDKALLVGHLELVKKEVGLRIENRERQLVDLNEGGQHV